MRIALCTVLTAACLTLAGCHSLSKQSATPGTPTASAGNDVRLQLPERGASLTNNPSTVAGPSSEINGVLAGQVLGPSSDRPPVTTIQVTEAAASPAAPPRETPCDGQGYFSITGLQPGKHYQLTARARNGNVTLIGTAFATPPDARILIQLSDNPVASGPVAAIVPAPRPALPGPDTQPAFSSQNPAPGRVPGWGQPAADADPLTGAASLGTPRAYTDPPPAPKAPASAPTAVTPPLHPESVATAPNPQTVFPDRAWGVPSNIPNQEIRVQPPSRQLLQPSVPALGTAINAAAPLPSCELIGQTCYNFALRDLDGQPWEYRKNPSKLTLLDFWGTWCPYCIQGIPHMKIFQSYYHSYGLQVVGIAYESDEETFRVQAQKVDRERRTRGINYQLLLGAGSRCPVRTQFQIRNYPTVILLDGRGRIIWRKEGLLRRGDLQELEIIIKQQLGFRGG